MRFGIKRVFKWALIAAALLLIGGYAYAKNVLAKDVDAKMNKVLAHAPYPISEQAKALHNSMLIADLHTDSLLWSRNLEKEHDYGHVDLPRLRTGGVDIQIFAAVTKSPKGQNFNNNSADAPDQITKLAMAQMWPPTTWTSIYERAAYQARRLQKVEARKSNNLVIARRVSDLQQPGGTLIAVLATEGSHPLEGKLENIQRLYDEGYRMMGLQHFFDNKLGGSIHGESKGGLTKFGRDAVLKMRDMDIIVDVAHSSEAVVRDVLALSPDPVIISHGGVASHCPRTRNRNFSDDILRKIAERGGLIGIGYFNGAICDITPKGIAKALNAAVNLLGDEAVALGSDFDGTVTTTLDTSELAAITQALIDLGMPETSIRKVMGGNVKRFLAENLPQ